MKDKEHVYVVECLYDCFGESDRPTWASTLPRRSGGLLVVFDNAKQARAAVELIKRSLMRHNRRWKDAKFRVARYDRVRP
jgi:hypothetical protein